jgi:hypothetical protein
VADKTVAQKARVKAGTAIAVINRVAGIVESLGLPEGVVFVKPARADLVFLFVRTRAELKARMPAAVAALGPASAILGLRPERLRWCRSGYESRHRLGGR